MTVLTQHAPGTFSWPELGTTDQNAAKKFYGELFSWTFTDNPMSDTETYTIFQKNGKDVGALYTQRKDQQQMGVPPNWGAYVTVTNADQSAEQAKKLGAKVLMEPFDVMAHGRMAVLQDPTGAVFTVWPGALAWTELYTTDPAKATTFYSGLLGWKAETMPMPQGDYTIFKRADGPSAGGMTQMPNEMKGTPPYWLSYFAVDDAQAVVTKTGQLGGSTLMPATPIPNVGTIAILKDPQGAAFAVIQPPR
jgi:uncharacterized protein